MTHEDPSSRPTAEGAQELFDKIVKRKFKVLLRRRLAPTEPTWMGNTYRAIASITDEIEFQVQRVSGKLIHRVEDSVRIDTILDMFRPSKSC